MASVGSACHLDFVAATISLVSFYAPGQKLMLVLVVSRVNQGHKGYAACSTEPQKAQAAEGTEGTEGTEQH